MTQEISNIYRTRILSNAWRRSRVSLRSSVWRSEEEKPVDLEAVRAELKQIEADKQAAIDKAELMLAQLGL